MQVAASGGSSSPLSSPMSAAWTRPSSYRPSLSAGPKSRASVCKRARVSPRHWAVGTNCCSDTLIRHSHLAPPASSRIATAARVSDLELVIVIYSQDVLIDTSALRTGGDGNGGISIPSAFAPTPAPISSHQSQFYDPTSSSFATVSHFSPSVAIIMVVLLSAFFFMGFFTLYVRRCADSSSSTSSGARGSLRRADYLQGQQDQGVDPELLHSLPLIAYSSAKKRGNNIECVVCLADFEEQEPLRQLPGCKHVFHPDCIDMWLFSHSTCPLCRCNITRSSGSFSLRWGGSGNIRQFLGGGGGSEQQIGLLGGGGGSGQQLSATESIGMVVHVDVPESNDTIIRIPRGLSTEMVAAAQRNGIPAVGTSISNFLQLPFAGMGANSANQSVRAAAAGGEGNFPPRSRAMLNMDVRRQQTTRLATANSTGHSLQVEASPLLSTISSGDSSCSRTSSIYRSSSEMVKQHGNLQGL